MRFRVRVQRIDPLDNARSIAELRIQRGEDDAWEVEALDKDGLRLRLRFAHDSQRNIWQVLDIATRLVAEHVS